MLAFRHVLPPAAKDDSKARPGLTPVRAGPGGRVYHGPMGRGRSTDAEDATAPHDEDPERPGPTDALRLLAIAIAAIAAMVAIAVDWESPLRVALTLAVFLFVPGLALAELLEIRDPVQRLAIATGASLAIETLVAVALLYAGLFSAEAASAVVVGLTCVALLAAVLWRDRRVPGRAPDTEPHRAAT